MATAKMIANRRRHSDDLRLWGDGGGGNSANGCQLAANKHVYRRICCSSYRGCIDNGECGHDDNFHRNRHRKRWHIWCRAGSTCNYALLIAFYVCCYLMTKTAPILAADVIAAPVVTTISITNDTNVLKNNYKNVTVVNDSVNNTSNNNTNKNNIQRPTTSTTQMAVKLKSVQQSLQSAGDIGAGGNGAADEDDYYDDDRDDLEYNLLISNKSATGMYIGAPCEKTCDPKLHHVFCDSTTDQCSCEKNFPVLIGRTKGCAKAKKLGEQCFYHQTCVHTDPNSQCMQVKHNALCQCASGYHSVTYSKPTKRVFCTQDMAVLTSDLPTLLGVTTGIAVLAGLICMVLHLFSKTKYPRHRNYADANIPPPIMYSTDTVHSGRPSSRSSMRSSNSIGSYSNRRPSSAPQCGSKGVLVSTSRSGSRRPSLASVHSTSSSVKSYSAQRIEKELQQKELRQDMKLRLARLQHNQQQHHHKPQIIIIGGGGGMGGMVGAMGGGGASSSGSGHCSYMGGDPLLHHGYMTRNVVPTPSPLTPNSTDELLPSVDEAQEFSPPLSMHAESSYIGPCSSSEALLE